MRRLITALCLLAVVCDGGEPRRLLMARHRSAAVDGASGPPVTRGLFTYYDMSVSGTNVLDQYGSLDAYAQSGVQFGSSYGASGDGAEISSNSDYITIPTNTITTFSIAFWIYPTSLTAGQFNDWSVFGSQKSPFRTRLRKLYLQTPDSSPPHYFLIQHSDNDAVQGTTEVYADNWYHVTCIWSNNAQVLMYVNGQLDASAAIEYNSDPAFDYLMGNISIDGAPEASSQLGYYDEIYLFNVALTSNEVQTIYSDITP